MGERVHPLSSARIREAWALGPNLRLVFSPSEGSIPAIDGIRAVALVWVVLMHAVFFLQPFIGGPPMRLYSTDPRLHLLWKADFAIELFLVLSGFLIGRILMRERLTRGRIDVAGFYVRRALRILPAYYVALALASAFGQSNLENTWANLVYVNNFLPYDEQNMVWAWSLAIEEQFYLVVPTLVLGLFTLPARLRVGLLLGGWAVSIPICAAIVDSTGLVVRDTWMVPDMDPDRWRLHFDHLYDKPYTRFGPLCLGLLLAHVQLVSPELVRKLGAWSVWRQGGLLVAAGGAMAYGLGFFPTPSSRPAEVLLLASARQVFATGVFTIMLLALAGGPVGARLAASLGARILHPVAQLTYSGYLVNPVMTLLFYAYVWSPVAGASLLVVTGYALANFAATLVAALALHLVIERPLMNLRSRTRHG
jgi:peptidoglycan/LPS O-acetylase OafA/YrhL